MFFYPVWMYLKALAVTLVVEVGMFSLIISRKPIKILAAVSFNILSHISLHLFFTLMIRTALGYSFWVWLIGEVLVVILEAILYYTSKIIPKISRAFLWSLVFNISSIVVGQLINLLLFS